MKATRWSCLPLLMFLLVAPSMQQTRNSLDLVFVVDGSDSVGPASFEQLKQTILSFALPQMTGNLYVGFVHYSTRLNKVVDLTSDPNEFQQEVNSVQYVGGETNTEVGIQWGLSVLMTTTKQSGAPQELIVIVDGVSRFPTDTKSVADFTRGMGVEITAVGVGPDITDEELLNIAGEASQVLKTQSFAVLPAIDLELAVVPGVTTTPGPVTFTPAPTTTTTTPRTIPTTTTTPRTIPTTTTTPRTIPTTTTTPRTIPTTTTTPRTIPTTTTTRRTPSPTTPRTIPPTTTTRPTPRPTTPRTIPTTTTGRPTPSPTTQPTRFPTRPTFTTRPPVITTTRSTTPRTTRRAPTTPYVEPYLDGLCEDAMVIDGVGYRAHPTDADKYVQCYFPSEDRTLAVVRECPFGLLWNRQARLCDTYLRVRLSEDPCNSRRVSSHPHEGNCRTFYNCEGGRSVPRCCPKGFLYDAPSQRCSPCNACNESCPVMCSTTTFACNKYPVFGDLTVYRKWTRTGDVIVPCENGTLFDLSACKCVDSKEPPVCQPDLDVPFNVAGAASSGVSQMTFQYDNVTLTGNSGLFDGVKSRLKVHTTPESAFDRPLVIRLTYREAADVTKPVALASTSRCGLGGLVLLSLERGGIKIEMSSYGRTPIIFRLPTAGFKKEDMKELLLYHDREHLTVIAMSGQLAYVRRAKVAILPYLQCGLEFGNSDWMAGFEGTISRVQLLRCDPSDFPYF